MAMAGHQSYSTTKRYVDLAGVVFEEAQDAITARRLGERAEAEAE
jgi:hypothetical protein